MKKKPLKCSDALDISSLTGIERSLTSAGLLNKDLNKLTLEEGIKVGLALKGNDVSNESWLLYLKLCKEYQKPRASSSNNNNQNTSGNTHSDSIVNIAPSSIPIPIPIPVPILSKTFNTTPNINIINNNNTSSIVRSQPPYPSNSHFTFQAIKPPSNYLGVIDQVNQPIDSRQLLMLRQSLFQEYLKKQQQHQHQHQQHHQQQSSIHNGNNSITINNEQNSIYNEQIHTNSSSHLNVHNPNITNTTITDTNLSDNCQSENENAILNCFDYTKDELNFNDFMNDYLI